MPAAPVKPYAHPKYPGIVVRTLKNGDLRYTVRYTAAGTKQKASRSFRRLNDARAFLAERDRLRIVERTGIDLQRGTETWNAHTNEWWKRYAQHHLEPETRISHRSAIQTHLAPRIGHLQLRHVTPAVVFTVQTDMLAAGVGGAQVQRTMSVLSGIMKRAVEWDRIDANPCRDIATPRAKRVGVIRPLSIDDVERIRLYFWDDLPSRLYVSLMAYAGMRPAEARGAQVGDVRWEEGSIDIAARGTGRERLDGNKAEGGRAMHLLDALRVDLMEAGVNLVDDLEQHLLLNTRGRAWTKAMHRDWYRKKWVPALIACGLPVQRAYILRHTHASLRIYEQRWTDTDLARMLGHDVRTLHEHYAHLMREASGRGPLDLARAIEVARDRHGTHPDGIALPERRPVRLTITATDRYGGDDIDRYRALLAEAGLTDIEITKEDAGA